MADTSSFSIGDIGTALGDSLKGLAGSFTTSILSAAKTQAGQLTGDAAQKIISNMKKSEPVGTNKTSIASPSQLVTKPLIPGTGAVQIAANKILGVTLSTAQVYWIMGLTGVLTILLIVKMVRK